MAEDRNVTGRINTPVALTLSGVDLPWGKWSVPPSPQIPADSKALEIFYAMGAKGSATGTEGTVSYLAADGTTFALYFDDPYSSGNNAAIRVAGASAAKYRCSVDYPLSGNSWVAVYSIEKVA